MIHVARLYLSQGTISTRLPFQDHMVGVSTLNLQKKCILVAEKSCYLQEQSSKLFFSLREFLFSLIKLFFFSIWTVKTSLRRSQKRKIWSRKTKFLSQKRNFVYELCSFRATFFRLLGTVILFVIKNFILWHIANARGTNMFRDILFFCFLGQLGVRDEGITIFWCFKAIKAKKAAKVARNSNSHIWMSNDPKFDF